MHWSTKNFFFHIQVEVTTFFNIFLHEKSKNHINFDPSRLVFEIIFPHFFNSIVKSKKTWYHYLQTCMWWSKTDFKFVISGNNYIENSIGFIIVMLFFCSFEKKIVSSRLMCVISKMREKYKNPVLFSM